MTDFVTVRLPLEDWNYLNDSKPAYMWLDRAELIDVSVPDFVEQLQAMEWWRIAYLIGSAGDAQPGSPLDVLDRSVRWLATATLAALATEDRALDKHKTILDDIARALHPHWPDGARKTYIPEQLPAMIRRLQEATIQFADVLLLLREMRRGSNCGNTCECYKCAALRVFIAKLSDEQRKEVER